MGLSFEYTEEAGAILLLGGPADWTHLDCDLHIKLYIKCHIENWVEFANAQLGMGLAEEDIIFVSGFTKTTTWAEAAFSDAQSRGELRITGGTFIPATSGEFRVTLSSGTTSSVSSRYGPSARFQKDAEPQVTRDQTIFLNYYKMKTRRFRGPKVIRGASGTPNLDGEDGNDPPGSSASNEQGLNSDSQSDTDSSATFSAVSIPLSGVPSTH